MTGSSWMLLLTVVSLSLLSRGAALDVYLTSITIYESHEMDFFFMVNPPEVYLTCEDGRPDVELEEVDEEGQTYKYEIGEVLATTLDASGGCVPCELRESDSPYGSDFFGSFNLCLDAFKDTGTTAVMAVGQFSSIFECPDCVKKPEVEAKTTPPDIPETTEPGSGSPAVAPAETPETPLTPSQPEPSPPAPKPEPEAPVAPAETPETPSPPKPSLPAPKPEPEVLVAPTLVPVLPDQPEPSPVSKPESPKAPAPKPQPKAPDTKQENQLDREILPGPVIKAVKSEPRVKGYDFTTTGMFASLKGDAHPDGAEDPEGMDYHFFKEVLITK